MHTKGLGWKATLNIATCGSNCMFEKYIGDKYEKLQADVTNLKKENVMLKLIILGFQDQLTSITVQQMQEGRLSDN